MEIMLLAQRGINTMDYYDRKADRIIRKLVQEGRRNFIIFPFGMYGMKVKELLNGRYGIMEKYVVDNGLTDISEIPNMLSICDMKNIGETGYTILFASDHGKLYNELRSQVAKIAYGNEIVDVFSPSMFFDEAEYYERSRSKDIRVAALEAAAKEIYRNNVGGAVAELGVYRGDFARFIAKLMPDRMLYLFDTFEGFDDRDDSENDDREILHGAYGEWNFKGTSMEVVLERIGLHDNVIVKKGYFPETSKGLEDEKFAFASIDTDLYEPTKAGLDFFYPRMSAGGYIFVHDFAELKGVRKAVCEFCSNGIGYMRLPDECHSAVIVKPF